MSRNFKESYSVMPELHAKVLETTEQSIEFISKQIEDLQREMLSIAQKEFHRELEKIKSIKGLGQKTAIALIIAGGAGKYFQRAKQFSRYVGLSPTYQQSGSSLKIRGRINRNGNPHLRSLLYMVSWSAIRFNKACKEFYERLKAKGKPSKVALIAVANKLIRQVFAILKDDQGFYIDGFFSASPLNASLRD